MTKLIAPFLLTLVLTACGGGGGGSGPTVATVGKNAVMSVGAHTNTVYTEAVADLNNDGLEDVVVGGWNRDSATAYVYVFMQNADGTLSDRTSLLPNNVVSGSQRVLLADFDNDGHVDIFIPGFSDGSTIYHENSVMFWGSSGAYTRNDWTDNSAAHGACMGDLNNDGRIDLLLAGSGAWINNGARGFTLTNLLANNYFAACAIVKEATTNSIYLGNNHAVAGYSDNINVYDFSLNLLSSTGYQTNNAYDTIDVVAVDLTSDGHADFVVSQNGTAINAVGPRQIVSYTGPNAYTVSATLETGRGLYYARAIGNDSVFFSGDTDNASVYRGTTKTSGNKFTTMAPNNSYSPANVYRNASNGKIYMLQLINNTFYTQEM